MGLTGDAKRGGLVETLAGAPRDLILRNGEIERFEDRHRGIFETWDGFFGRGSKPTAREVRDLVALALVGGGLADREADAILAKLGPDENLDLYRLAQAALGVAFLPEAEAGAEDAAAAEGASIAPSKKKTAPAPGA